MRAKLAIIVGKLLKWCGDLIGRGSITPGTIAIKLYPHLWEYLKLPKTVIAVTGSSGKGSVTSMITKVLRDSGYQVVYNDKGSNLTDAVLTSLLGECKLNGKIKGEYLVCEVDERYTKYVFPKIKPNYVVITNLTRDQPPRQGHFDLVFEEIKKAIDDSMHLILNSDDPYLYKFTFDHKGPITYYGIHKNQYSYTKSKFENLNLIYCPKCHKKMTYHYYHFENIGDFECEKCHFQRIKPQYEVTKLDYQTSLMTINQEYQLHMPSNILYCVYNTLACFTVLSLLGLEPKQICEYISNMSYNTKIYDEYTSNGRQVVVLNNKNENSTTFNQSLLYVDQHKEPKTIVIGWKEISRRYHYDDLSWLYDIDFEILKDDSVDKILCVGIHRFDIATRMKYAGIEDKKILVFETLEEMMITLKEKTKGSIYAILNFDYVEPFNTLMNTGDKNENNDRTSLL